MTSFGVDAYKASEKDLQAEGVTLHGASEKGDIAMALTERERQILRLHSEGLTNYRIARKLKMEKPNVTRSRKNALKKLKRARADLEYIDRLKSQLTH
jgi:DNA-binding NarL/FixJ family response regulator